VSKGKARKVISFWARFAQTQPYKNDQLFYFRYQDIDYQNGPGIFPKYYPVMSWMEAITPLIEQLAQRKSPDRWQV
jgi:hypothetical protein